MTDARFSHYAAAAPHHLAAESGRAVMQEGGNAIEAMLAMAATIAVVYPHMNSLGGDGFWLIADPRRRVHYVEACGPAGARATIKRYREAGYDAIPSRGPEAALTVPGAVGGFLEAHELAQRLGGRLPLPDLFGDAVRLAREGCKVAPSLARNQPSEFDALKAAPGFASAFLEDGKLPQAGAVLKQPALADMIEHMARAGLDDFYRGDVGREIAADLDVIGSAVTREDLRAYRAVRRQPLSVDLKAARLFNAPPPTQGLAALMILALFERLAVKKPESFEHVHGLIEATKLAFAARNRIVTDFAHLREEPEDVLTKEHLDHAAASIDMKRAGPFGAAVPIGDTVWMGAIDAEGVAVSYIQSAYWEFGSGCVLPRTGLLMQNRGVSFSLDPEALNPLQPGRRPFHTLNPPLALFRDGRIMSYGAMGGDGQPQFQAELFTRHVMFGQPLHAAIDAPRWLLGRTWGKTRIDLTLENRFDDSLVRALEKAGHPVLVLDAPYDEGLGHAGALMRYPDGSVEAAHDPRSDGGALGG
ncbi:gamma-glutamyltranspeptidase / glutathione hydrolase [Rhizobiales bacterium GAS191]|nr:gamma-glutamyltranspeptidase / glutathione hydrolase [Rhizobiales bacterium GAS191]